VITKPNYETKVMEFDVMDSEKKKDLGTITLYSALTSADQGLAIIDNMEVMMKTEVADRLLR
jgi:hypothetical protein